MTELEAIKALVEKARIMGESKVRDLIIAHLISMVEERDAKIADMIEDRANENAKIAALESELSRLRPFVEWRSCKSDPPAPGVTCTFRLKEPTGRGFQYFTGFLDARAGWVMVGGHNRIPEEWRPIVLSEAEHGPKEGTDGEGN